MVYCREKLDIPFNILKQNGETILCQSGIKDWEEELTHLRNQLSPSQIGSCEGFDMRQKNRDERVLRDKERLENKREKIDLDEDRENHHKKSYLAEALKFENSNLSNNNSRQAADDDDFEDPKERKEKKIDVMGAISRTSDAKGISIRDRTVLAASDMIFI